MMASKTTAPGDTGLMLWVVLARASTTHSISPVSPGAVVLDAIIRRNLLGSRNVSRIGVSRILDIFHGGATWWRI